MLRYAADFLTRGRVVAVPTDTVYGLAADPFNLSAVEEIYRVKGRPETRALPILVNSIDQAMLLARDVPENFLRLAHEFWPGALTLVVDAGHRSAAKSHRQHGACGFTFATKRDNCGAHRRVRRAHYGNQR